MFFQKGLRSFVNSIGLVQSLLANQNVQLDVLTNQTTAVGSAEHAGDAATQYPVSSRYSNPGQVIFGGVEMGRIIQNPPQLPLPPPPPPPPQAPMQLSAVEIGTMSTCRSQPRPCAQCLSWLPRGMR